MYVPITRKIIYSYDVIFDESFSSTLAYTSQTYAESVAMRLAVSYTSYATYSKEQTGNIITFTQFEVGNVSSETRDDVENGEYYDDDSVMPPLISKEEMDAMYYGNVSKDEYMYTEMGSVPSEL